MYLVKEGALLFLSLFTLLFILKFKPTYLNYYPRNFKLLTTGFLVFSLTFGTRLFSKILFLSDNLYFRAFEAVGLILGASFCLSGFFRLLFWSNKLHLDFRDRLRQISCIKNLSFLPERVTVSDDLLKEVFCQIMLTMRYKMGAVYKSSFNSNGFSLLGYWQIPSEKIQLLYSVPEQNSFFKEAITTKEPVTCDDPTMLPECNKLFLEKDKIQSFACVPIRFKDKVFGVIGVYDQKPHRFTYQETLFLSGLGRLLGFMTERAILSERNKWRRSYISVAEEFSALIFKESKIEEIFPEVARLLKKVLDFDYLSLAVVDSSGENMSRLSMAGEWNLLLSKQRSLPTHGTLVEKVKKSGEPQIVEDIGSDALLDDSLVKATGIRSAMLLPLSPRGVLTFGSVRPKNYYPKDAKWLKLVCSLLELFLLRDELDEKLSLKEKKLAKLNQIARKSLDEKDLDKVFDYAAETLTCGLPASFCRISVLSKKDLPCSQPKTQKEDSKPKNSGQDPTGSAQLLSLSSFKIRDSGINLKDQKKFSLSELPWHRFVLEAKRPVLVNQDDPESMMSDEEAAILMDRKINSALLVPLVVNQSPVGIISVGEMRNWERRPFTQEEIDFLETVSYYLGLALRKNLTDKSSRKLIKDKFFELSLKINNYLSSILGSAELIQQKKDFLDDESQRYLKQIQKNSERIKKELVGFSATQDNLKVK